MGSVCEGRYVIAEAKAGDVPAAPVECAATASREP
jgi:hypothetical protein